MKKISVLLLLFVLCSFGAFANVEQTNFMQAKPLSCNHYESGTLSCGIAYSMCAEDRKELDEIYKELEELACD